MCFIINIVCVCLLLGLQGTTGEITLTTKPADASVELGENVTLQCEVLGRQDETVEWYKGNTQISSNQQVIANFSHRYTIAGEFNLVISTVQISDSDQYTCNVSGLGKSSANLTVLFPPVTTTDKDTFTVYVGYSAWFSCYIQASPAPTISWLFNGMVIKNNDNIKIFSSGTELNYRSKMSIVKVAQADLGKYSCVAENTLGNSTQDFTLAPVSVPEAPVDLTFLNKTWNSVLFNWTGGFDGGVTQRYFINVSTHGDHVRVVPVFPLSSSMYNVTRLRPNTTYNFTVVGKNLIGFGEPSEELIVETEALFIPSIGQVVYDVSSRDMTLENKIPENHHIRVEVQYRDSGEEWKVLYELMHFDYFGTNIDVPNITALRLYVCLNRRIDVCGEAVIANLKNIDEGLSTGAIIGICIAVVVFLLAIVVLVALFVRKRKARGGIQKF